MISNRTFGVEIEISSRSEDEMAALLRRHGISVYNINDRTFNIGTTFLPRTDPAAKKAWKIVYDSSVPGGCEVVSPILSGAQGLAAVRNIVKIMNKNGAKANFQCGLHVHVGAEDLSLMELLNVARRYAAYESTIDSFVAPSRRNNNSKYCYSVQNVMLKLEKTAWGDPKDLIPDLGSRYHKVNLQAFLEHGTVEFRQMEGTTSWTKICAWIEFCVAFVEASRLAPEVNMEFTSKAEAKSRKLPNCIRQLSPYNTSTLVERDLSYIWEVEDHEVYDMVNYCNKICSGILEAVDISRTRIGWVVNYPVQPLSLPEVTKPWDYGVPINVVAQLHTIARSHPPG